MSRRATWTALIVAGAVLLAAIAWASLPGMGRGPSGPPGPWTTLLLLPLAFLGIVLGLVVAVAGVALGLAGALLGIGAMVLWMASPLILVGVAIGAATRGTRPSSSVPWGPPPT